MIHKQEVGLFKAVRRLKEALSKLEIDPTSIEIKLAKNWHGSVLWHYFKNHDLIPPHPITSSYAGETKIIGYSYTGHSYHGGYFKIEGVKVTYPETKDDDFAKSESTLES